MIRYDYAQRDFVTKAYHDGSFGPPSQLADLHIEQSDMFVAVVGVGLLGVFGAKALSRKTAYIWFSETSLLPLQRIGFLRSVHTVVDIFHLHYSELVGLCFDPRSGAWLRWIGAEFTDDNSFSFRRA